MLIGVLHNGMQGAVTGGDEWGWARNGRAGGNQHRRENCCLIGASHFVSVQPIIVEKIHAVNLKLGAGAGRWGRANWTGIREVGFPRSRYRRQMRMDKDEPVTSPKQSQSKKGARPPHPHQAALLRCNQDLHELTSCAVDRGEVRHGDCFCAVAIIGHAL